MLTRAVVVIALVAASAALARCAPGRAEGPRTLPADRRIALVYVALGDSTVEGVAASGPQQTYVGQLHERLTSVYPAARAVNAGRAGAVSADVVGHQLPLAIDQRPHLVTLSVGPNDLTAGVPVTAYERNLATIFRRLTGETDALVIANLLPDLAVTPRFRASPRRSAVAQLTIEFNEALARQAREYGVGVVDLYRASQVEVPRRPELVSADGYHPSDLGYARWAELMWTRIEPRVPPRE